MPTPKSIRDEKYFYENDRKAWVFDDELRCKHRLVSGWQVSADICTGLAGYKAVPIQLMRQQLRKP